MLGGAAAGAAGLLLTLLGGLFAPKAAFYSYLIAFNYWLGLSLGALALVMANNTAGARWNVVLRRIGETLASAAPLFIVLFIPLLLGAKQIWIWVDPAPGLPKETVELIQHKRPYLNIGFFTLRAIIYFAVWSALALLLRAWSVRQDESGAAELTKRQRKLSAPGMVLLMLTATFAAFDWLMSLHPTWYSTIFGLYVFAGAFVGSLALLCLIVTGLRSAETALGKIITAEHQHNLGKLLFAFVCFWAYMAFSQYMLIWAGNLPEEVTWIIARSRGVWRPVGLLILLGHFLVPFFLLLSRDLKRSPQALAAVATWMLVIHYIDLYWIVMPAISLDTLGLHWTHFTAFIGVGGLSIAAAVYQLRGVRPLPVRDPYLEDSLRYIQP
jgi:hypothetical protein